MPPMKLHETPRFRRWVRKAKVAKLVDALVLALLTDPTTGDVIPGSGGIRKVRMAGHGRGKSGGYRVIYTVVIDSTLLILLDGYSKSDQEDLSDEELARLIKTAKAIEAEARAAASEEQQGTEEK